MEQVPKLTEKNIENAFLALMKAENVELIKDINREYLYWDKVKYKQSDFSPIDLWALIKLSRQINYSDLQFDKYNFKFYSTEYILEMLHSFDMNIGGYLGSNDFIPEQEKNRYIVNSIMEEAISSSKMEGASTTRKKAKDILRKEEKPRDKSERMIVNNYHTMQYITQHKEEDLTPEKLLYIHSSITKDTLDTAEEEGAFRKNDDILVVNTSTSEAVHTPPNYKEIPELIESICAFFNEDKTFIHPIIKGIIIHFMIAWIHPFSDGNGRTARSLFYWYLSKKGYWLTEYLSISRIIQHNKSQYEKAYLYTENDENDLNYFIVYNLKAMEKAFNALKAYIQKKTMEVKQIARFIRLPNINERQAYLLKKLYDNAELVLTIKELKNRFSISDYTARTDLARLVEGGFLEEKQVNKKQKHYLRSKEFLSLISSSDEKDVNKTK
ncbi:Fic family protein [Massilibacteroides sp.]|uniref:Fic family protein n=1 Tax=Massilibacteroides sp. TaxID=2034766 RepID=UPI002630C490|nr:Fic family protein [Massilibacteroides sp.]MDD4515365.1 Fic family protein [Massilibacteroides sp.]